MSYALNPNLFKDDIEREPIRAGFGRGLKKAGEKDEKIVALCADLTESVQMHLFRDAFPNRFWRFAKSATDYAAPRGQHLIKGARPGRPECA